MSAHTWIGLDPALTAFGWVVMHRELGGQPTVVNIGTWRTKADARAGKLEDRAARVRELGLRLLTLIDSYGPDSAYVESLAYVPGKTSGPATSVLGRVRGLIEGICFARDVEIAEVRPDIVKQAVTGRRDASKEQVARILARAYPYAGVLDADSNATDALAVAHVGAHRHGNGVTVENGVVRYRDVAADDDLFV